MVNLLHGSGKRGPCPEFCHDTLVDEREADFRQTETTVTRAHNRERDPLNLKFDLASDFREASW